MDHKPEGGDDQMSSILATHSSDGLDTSFYGSFPSVSCFIVLFCFSICWTILPPSVLPSFPAHAGSAPLGDGGTGGISGVVLWVLWVGGAGSCRWSKVVPLHDGHVQAWVFQQPGGCLVHVRMYLTWSSDFVTFLEKKPLILVILSQGLSYIRETFGSQSNLFESERHVRKVYQQALSDCLMTNIRTPTVR